MRTQQSALYKLWIRLIGDAADFSVENRAYNAISVITFIILSILLPFNIYIGLPVVYYTVLVVIVIQSIFYYYSRFRKKYAYSMSCYAIISYIILIINYFHNSGSQGPTIYLFFLSFQLLVAFTSKRLHSVWMLTHLVIISVLLAIEYYYPVKVPNTYLSKADRFFDLSSSSLVIFTGIYFITIYLRSNYNREKRLAEEHAAKILEQNVQINEKNVQLHKLNIEKNKILSVLGHDLRAPLTSITSVLELLTLYPVPEQRRKELQTELLLSARNTSDMVGNLLTWSQKQMNGLQANLQKVEINQIVEGVVAQQMPFAAAKAITIRNNVTETLFITADEGMFELSIRNIVNNAIKFTAEGGLISIGAASTDGKECIICIRDNGQAMNAAQLENLFTLDIHSTYGTNNEKGIGLGMVLCKEFAELQNARIWAKSEIGRGSTFYIALPVYKTEEVMAV